MFNISTTSLSPPLPVVPLFCRFQWRFCCDPDQFAFSLRGGLYLFMCAMPHYKPAHSLGQYFTVMKRWKAGIQSFGDGGSPKACILLLSRLFSTGKLFLPDSLGLYEQPDFGSSCRETSTAVIFCLPLYVHHVMLNCFWASSGRKNIFDDEEEKVCIQLGTLLSEST
jgi:hypothetical protein